MDFLVDYLRDKGSEQIFGTIVVGSVVAILFWNFLCSFLVSVFNLERKQSIGELVDETVSQAYEDGRRDGYGEGRSAGYWDGAI